MATASNLLEDDSQEVNDWIADLLSSSGKTEVSIALVGETRSGKSSFINGVLSKVKGSVNNKEEPQNDDRTSAPKCYSHPESENIKLWDLPGYGTASYPDIKRYWQMLDLDKYDAYLLFTKTRFTIDNQRLAVRIGAKGKPFFVIRTFIDEDVENEKKSKETAFNEDKMLEEIRENIKENLKDISGEEIFLISNVSTDKWDFDRLNENIVYELSAASLQTTSNWKKMLCPKTVAQKLAGLSLMEKWENVKCDKKTLLENLKKQLAEEQRTMQDYGALAAQQIMKEQLECWKETEINLAIIGEPGAGKSSFINALRGIPDNDPKAAKVGVTETTLIPTDYPHPSNPNITLWDLPGCGTESFPDLKTYCKKVEIEKYDAFIVMTDRQFTSNVGELAKKVFSLNKPFFFVRAKIDQAYTSTKHSEGSKFNQVRMEEEIKAECLQKLKLNNERFDDNHFFYISSHFPHQWDFPRLIESIQRRLTFSQQESFIFSMHILSHGILDEKVKKLRGRVWRYAWLSIIRKAVTPKSFSRRKDCNAIARRVKFYRSQLGFPENGSDEFQMMSEELQASAQDFYQTRENDVTFWLNKINTNGGNEGLPSWFDVKKAIDEPYDFVELTLNSVLDEMKEIASKILDEATAREQANVDEKINSCSSIKMA